MRLRAGEAESALFLTATPDAVWFEWFAPTSANTLDIMERMHGRSGFQNFAADILEGGLRWPISLIIRQ